MMVSIFGEQALHQVARSDADPRVAWTTCGLRFAWGSLARWRDRPRTKCPTCFPVA